MKNETDACSKCGCTGYDEDGKKLHWSTCNELDDGPKEPRLPELGPKDIDFAKDGLEGAY